MVHNNKKCMVCGKVYTYCDRCEEFDNLPRWMNLFDCENCRSIFNTLTDYNINKLPKEDAIKRLKECDLSEMYKKEFNPCITKQVEALLSSEEAKHINEVKSAEIKSAEVKQPVNTDSKTKRMKHGK